MRIRNLKNLSTKVARTLLDEEHFVAGLESISSSGIVLSYSEFHYIVYCNVQVGSCSACFELVIIIEHGPSLTVPFDEEEHSRCKVTWNTCIVCVIPRVCVHVSESHELKVDR
jgi:hypothetical protein